MRQPVIASEAKQSRSIGGCFVREAFKYNPDTWDGRIMYSLSKALGFSL